jgi:hypothetical protein
MSYYDSALSFLRTNGEGADYDEWRDQFGVAVDGVELFTAWCDARADLFG